MLSASGPVLKYFWISLPFHLRLLASGLLGLQGYLEINWLEIEFLNVVNHKCYLVWLVAEA